MFVSVRFIKVQFKPEKNNQSLDKENSALPPSEIIAIIASFFDRESFFNARLVCRMFEQSLQWQLQQLLKIKQIALGSDGLLLLHNNGIVSFCQPSQDLKEPLNAIRIVGLPVITQIAANEKHFFYLDINGQVWFSGELFKLNPNNVTPNLKPMPLTDMTPICQMAVGLRHALFLGKDGTVFSFGFNKHYELGLGDNYPRKKPTKIKNLDDVIQVAATQHLSFFLKNDRSVWRCGLEKVSISRTIKHPLQFQGITDIRKIFAGPSNSFFIKQNGDFWGYGKNESGELGQGHREIQITPILLSNLRDVIDVAIGSSYSLFITKNRSVLGSGDNREGEIGLDECDFSTTPQQIASLNEVKQIIASDHLSIFLMQDGRILTSGNYAHSFFKISVCFKTPQEETWPKVWQNTFKTLYSKSPFFHESSHENLLLKESETTITDDQTSFTPKKT